MAREEEILNAARTRAERHQIAEMELYGGDKCNYSYGRIYFSEIASFEACAKWADQHPNNVWHDASEEPICGKRLLLLHTNSVVSIFEYTGKSSWSMLVSCGICQYAYISELLPKGGER